MADTMTLVSMTTRITVSRPLRPPAAIAACGRNLGVNLFHGHGVKTVLAGVLLHASQLNLAKLANKLIFRRVGNLRRC